MMGWLVCVCVIKYNIQPHATRMGRDSCMGWLVSWHHINGVQLEVQLVTL